MQFSELDLMPELQRALTDCGYTTATEIQEKTIKAFLEGKHIVGQSQTGSGKTAAFVLPILNSIEPRKRAPQVLMLAPTRELAAQIREEIFTLSKHMRMLSLTAVGGTSKRKQIDILSKGPQIVVGTPGRVKDLIEMGKLRLQNIKYFVLDEVDRMLDMGFIDDIREIWQRLDTVEQALTFSATLPTEAKELISQFIGDDYTSIKISEQIVVDKVAHMFVNIDKDHKYEFLTELLANNKQFKVLVFAEMKRTVDELARKLKADGFGAQGLHGDMEQRDRFHTLRRIKNDECKVMVATDVAARGLNMNKVDLVINYDVPNDPESYVHRIGRTARAGRSGNALMFVTNEEWDALHAIERRNKMKIAQINQAGEEVERTDRPKRSSSGNRYNRYRRGGGGGGGRGRGRKSYGNRSRSGGHSSRRSNDRRRSNTNRGEGRARSDRPF